MSRASTIIFRWPAGEDGFLRPLTGECRLSPPQARWRPLARGPDALWRRRIGNSFPSFAFRPEAVRLVVINADGQQAEATLGAATDIRMVLR